MDEKESRFRALHNQIWQAARTERKIAKPVRKLGALRECRASAWDNEWYEAVILVRCMARVRPRRTHSMLSQLSKRYEKNGNSDRFAELEQTVKDILAPDFLTPHGYSRTFGSYDNDALAQEMHSGVGLLEPLGYPVMLYAGALLGTVRDGKFIEHDDDIDLAVMLGEQSRNTIFDAWLAYKKRLLDLDLLAPGEAELDSAVFKIKSPTVTMEVFPAWQEKGKFSVYPYSLEEMDDQKIFPLKAMTESALMLPQDEEALLEQSYGSGWRVPDPFFHVNWARQRRRFSFLFDGSYSL